MSNILLDIKQNCPLLTEEGLFFLYELELGDKEGWEVNNNLKLDEEGNIAEIKVHDAGDGGFTIGPGIFISENNQKRIELATSLGINWNDTNEWVAKETVDELFFSIAQEYHGKVKYIENETGVTLTPEQYAAVFSLVYFRQAFTDNIITLINSNADKETWKENLIEELQGLSSFDKNPGWQTRIERTVNLYFDGTY